MLPAFALVAGLVALLFFGACSAGRPLGENLASEGQALTVPAVTLTLSVPLPPKVEPNVVALGAQGSLRVNDRASVVSSVGTPAMISNIGTSETNVGTDANVGNVWTRPALTLRERAQVSGFLRTQAGIIPQNMTIAGPMFSTFVPNAPSLVTWSVQAGTNSGGDVNLEPSTLQTLAPGRFGNVNVKSNSLLNVRTGTYVLESLSLEPGAALVVDVAQGPVYLYVRQSLIYRGKITILHGGAGDLLLGYLGTASAFLEAPFNGTAVAPNASLVLASLTSGQHQGSFFGRNIEVHQGSVVRLVPFRWWKTFESRTPCPGLTAAQSSAINPYTANDFFRLCSSGTLPTGRPLLQPNVFAQLRTFEASARTAEANYIGAVEKVLEVDTFFVDPTGTPPGKTIAQADADLTTTSDAVAALIAQRDAFMASVVAGTTADPAALTTAALANFWSNTRGSMVVWSPAKRFEMSCEEVVRSEIGLDIAEALARNDMPKYLEHLSRLQKALSCSTLENALAFSQALVLGFDDAVAKFPPALRPNARHALFASLINVVVLLQDLTKFAAPTPLYQWMSLHKNELSAEISLSTSVLLKTGLWLRNPSSDALVQIPNLCEVSTAGFCVSIGHLLHALTDPSRLGLGTCAAFSMVTEKPTFNPAEGYACSDYMCVKQAGGGPALPQAPSLMPAGLVDFTKATPTTLFGVELGGAAQQQTCNRRGGDGGGGGGTPIEQAARCVLSGSEAGRARALAQCIGEAGESSTYRGWPSDTCTNPRGADVGEGAPVDPSKPLTDEEKKKFEDAKKLAEQKAGENAEKTKNGAASANNQKTGTHYDTSKITADAVKAAVNEARVVDSTSVKGAGNTPVTIDTHGKGSATPGTSQISDAFVRGASVERIAEAILHEAAHSVLSKAIDAIKNPDGKVLENQQHKIMCGKNGCGAIYCAESGNGCGGCSPNSALTTTLKRCGISLEMGLPPVSPLSTLIYPLDPPGSSNGWASCLAGLLPTGLQGVPATCAALMCPPESLVTVSATTCTCGGSSGSGPLFRVNRCGAVDCPDGMPVIGVGGTCTCVRGGFQSGPTL